jgi:hypothetical protein
MILEVCWDGIWKLSFGLSQFHGHISWLVCEVALSNGIIIGYWYITVINLPLNKLHRIKVWKVMVAMWEPWHSQEN